MASSALFRGYRFGSFVLDLEWGGLLTGDGGEMPLRPKSFVTELWPNLFVTENNVTQCIHNIRRALGSEAFQTLQTLPRRGYRFTADVVAIPADAVRHRPNESSISGDETQISSSFVASAASDLTEPRRNVDASGVHSRLMEIPIDLARIPAAVGFNSPGAVRRDGDALGRQEIDAHSFIWESIRSDIDRFAMETPLTDMRTYAGQGSERLDVDMTTVTDKRLEVSPRVAWTLFMQIIEDVNHQINVLDLGNMSPSDRSGGTVLGFMADYRGCRV
jgi:hypothetical protein